MNVLILGYNGFLGRNFLNFLEINRVKTFKFGRKNSFSDLDKIIKKINIIFHFAGENRTKNKKKFIINNQNLTENLIKYLEKKRVNIPVVYSSTIKINETSDYGRSKKKCEEYLIKSFKKNKNSLAILRLPNLFGKWSKPDYNSVVATFSYHISRNSKVKSNNKKINLYYIDDLVKLLFRKFVLNYSKFHSKKKQIIISKFKPIKSIKVNQIESKIIDFENSRKNLLLPNIKSQFDKKLYSTYLTYLPTKKFTYNLNQHLDKRGIFCEVFKHKNFGQISFLTINPHQIRGEHFHNTKVEKFLLISGKCKFKFNDQNSSKKITISCDSKNPKIVETIPGWVHKIYNPSNKLAIVMIWTNEVFDVNNPDTYSKKKI